MSALLSQKVYEQLYAAMLDHRLKPVDRLNRRQVAEDFGVSVAPVLEAMTQLEWEGFLSTSPRLGTVVRAVTARQVLGKFRLRQAIEVEAARISAGSAVQALRPRLDALAAKADLRTLPPPALSSIIKTQKKRVPSGDHFGCLKPPMSRHFSDAMRSNWGAAYHPAYTRHGRSLA